MKLFVRIVLVAVIALVIAYAGVVGYMYVNQRALQYDVEGPITALAETPLSGAMAVSIPSGDGVINGWYQAPSAGKPVIIYYKGNSGSFSEEYKRFVQFVADGFGFLSFDYRGFPMSPGEISQAGILEDATNGFDWANQQGFPIVIWGRSLGSGPATYVASVRDATALLLETPFLSAATVGAERYPYLPVALVMQDQYPVNQWIVNVSEPVLVAHGTGDVTIDVNNGERVYELVPNKEALWIEPGAGHSDLWDRGIWTHAQPFFERTLAGK
ncbi:MAG: hypothetical protein MO846_00355 [Candidatus Devosia symbiotica]|nr:hypothetical protein [Candidatus Devosia symbiotica]